VWVGWTGDELGSKVNDRALPVAACPAGPDDTESRTTARHSDRHVTLMKLSFNPSLFYVRDVSACYFEEK